MSNILSAVLNTVFVSIPEEFVWVVLTLILLKRFDLLDIHRWKENIKWILIPVIPTVIVTNVLKYFNLPRVAWFVSCSIIIYTLLIYIVKKTDTEECFSSSLKVIICSFIASFIIMITESIYCPIVLSILDTSISEVNSNIVLNVILSSPSRLFQGLLIVYILHRRNTVAQLPLFKTIINDKVLLLITAVFFIIMFVSMYLLISVVGDYNVFKAYSIYLQMLVSILIVCIPTLIIFIYTVPISYLANKIVVLNKSHVNMFNDEIDN